MSERRTPWPLRIVPHLAAILVIGAAIHLALWQLDRAEEKQTLLTQWQDAEEIALGSAAPSQLPAYARIVAEGRFDIERQILLDNQVRNLQAGVHVFTPFQPTGASRTWLVNRGWQPMPDRSRRPEFETPDGRIEIRGRLTEPPRVGVQLGRAEALDPDHWPNLMTYFDLERIREVLGEDVAERVILLDPQHSAHLSGDDWQPVTFGPERHRAYAFQWASIALVVAAIWLFLTLRSFRRP